MSQRTIAAVIGRAAARLRENTDAFAVVLQHPTPAGSQMLVLARSHRLYPTAVEARADAVRQSNKGQAIRGFVVGVSGETYTVYEAMKLNGSSGRFIGNRRFLEQPLYIGPARDPEAPEPIVVPGRRYRRSSLAGRLAA